MSRVTTEQIFQALFSLAQTVQGADWSGDPIPLQYFTRNWVKVNDTEDASMPALYQLDPLPEKDVRTGLGRSRRMLHAQIDIRIQRQQADTYSDTQPFSTILNNWIDNLYLLFSPADGGEQTLNGLVTDCYPIGNKPDYGNDQSRVAIAYTTIELIAGG